MKKLYELKGGEIVDAAHFGLVKNEKRIEILRFEKIDGMYAQLFDNDGIMYNIPAYTEVLTINKKNND